MFSPTEHKTAQQNPVPGKQSRSESSNRHSNVNLSSVHFNWSAFPIQPKLQINQPGDRYEQEADRIAEQVVSMHESDVLQESGFKSVQRKPLADEISVLSSSNLQRTTPSQATTASFQSELQITKGGGQPMTRKTLSSMNSRFGMDFSHVRIHNDEKAAHLSQNINAKAFTLGNDIYFNHGQYQPNTTAGERLLAHELVHTEQQTPNSIIQRDLNVSLDPVREALRMTTGELEEQIREMRDFLANATESTEESVYYTEALPIMEGELLRRQNISSGSRRLNNTIVESVRSNETFGDLGNLASFTFVNGFVSQFVANTPPGSMHDAIRDLANDPLEFQLGYISGIPSGMWAGLTGLIEGLWTLVRGGGSLFMEGMDFMSNPLYYTFRRREEINKAYQLIRELHSFYSELREDPASILELSGEMGEASGFHMANVFTEDFLRVSVNEKGQKVGYIAGIILFELILEIILALATKGIGNIARGVAAGGQSARAGGRLASVIRRLVENYPSLARIRRIFSTSDEALDIAGSARVIDNLDNAPQLPMSRMDGVPEVSSQSDNLDNVIDLSEYRSQRQRSMDANEAIPNRQAAEMDVPVEQEMPMAVGQTHYPDNQIMNTEVPRASAGRNSDDITSPNYELVERRRQQERQTQRRSERQSREAARGRPTDSRTQDLAEVQITASRRAGRLMADAEEGRFIGIHFARRREILGQYRRLLESSGLHRVLVNQRVGRMNELFSETPNIISQGRAQTAFRHGERLLEDDSLRGSTIPDIIRSRVRNGRRVNVHFNLKSDRIDWLNMNEAAQRAREYTRRAEVQAFGAQTNETRRLRGLQPPEVRSLRRGNRFGNLPEGESMGIEYIFVPDEHIQEAMVLEHFVASSPIVEVRFGSITYIRTDAGFIRH